MWPHHPIINKATKRAGGKGGFVWFVYVWRGEGVVDKI